MPLQMHTKIHLKKEQASSTYQFDDLDEDPVVSGGGHQFKEKGGQGQVVLGVSSCQLTDDINCC